MANLKQAFCALGILGASATAAQADVSGVIIQGKAPHATITELSLNFRDAQTCVDFGNTLSGNYVLSCFDNEDGELVAQRICSPVQYRPRDTQCNFAILGNE